jgi:AraC-like DNA-binding protein
MLRRDKFVETVAALQGIDPESVSLAGSKMELPPAVLASVHNAMNNLIVLCGDNRGNPARLGRRFNIADEALCLAAEAYLRSDANADFTEPRNSNPPEKIVRLAEEYFLAAGGEPVALADLCKASGVGKTRLYAAFAEMCGEPPLSYFRKRQLTQARCILLNSDAKSGAVKRAAMSSGLTELGRFSVEYRELFGETPSATLRDGNERRSRLESA